MPEDAGDTEPLAKRPRLDSAALGEVSSPICEELLSSSSRESLRASFKASQPYCHAVLSPLCHEADMRGAFDEMRTHLSGTFKETDLFKARAAAAENPTGGG
jgi:hypothetical protein